MSDFKPSNVYKVTGLDFFHIIFTVAIILFAIHEMILSPLTDSNVINYCIRGGDGSLCGFGWLWFILFPFIPIWLLLSVAVYIRNRKREKENPNMVLPNKFKYIIFFLLLMFVVILFPMLITYSIPILLIGSAIYYYQDQKKRTHE